ncbi:hypothetical protein C8F01DRAFT_1162580 [Mycena amicta]|nr:hypothetical protein C8F01DRAFT_1162580 [Mycena amicta]
MTRPRVGAEPDFLGTFMSTVQDGLLPPELIDLIIDKLIHTKSLKACSLAATLFRKSCQKRLLHSLNLSARPVYRRHPYTEVAARFDESPYLAGYVTRIVVYLPANVAEWDDNRGVAESVFRRLNNIREATIQGNYSTDARNTGLSAEMLDWTVQVLQTHGALQKLSLWSFEKLPLSVVERALAATPSICFSDVRVDDSAPRPPAMANFGRPASLERLKIWHSPSINALLLRPECAQYTASLRALILCEEHNQRESMFALCFMTAQWLEHLELQFTSMLSGRLTRDANINLPAHLPRLRGLVVRFINSNLAAKWFTPSFLIKLLSHHETPALHEVTLGVSVQLALGSDDGTYAMPSPETFAELDQRVDEHPTITTVRWSLAFFPFGEKKGIQIAAYSKALEDAMPKAFAKGLLVFETSGDSGLLPSSHHRSKSWIDV